MKSNAPIDPVHYDRTTTDPAGYRDKRGEWRPADPVAFAPIFVWPVRAFQFLLWLRSYLFSWNILWFGITLSTWLYFQPSLETCQTFQAGWIAQMFARNLVLLWIVFGGWHLYLYSFKLRGHRGKYSPRWQSTDGTTYLFRNQVQDNVFWSCGSGCITWTAYEVITMWMYANHLVPYINFRTSPALFIAVLLLIPFWREFHFYWIHRLIHWKPLYDKIHYLHHYNINPGPWSGLAMHPIEHLLYFSVTLIHWIIPSHPIHFLFNAQHTALTPAAGHTGFEGKLGEQVSFGSYFHYLHHRHFDCNYGEATLPLDKWFGSFDDGERTDSEKSEARRTYHCYVVDRIVDESVEVKSFYLKRADGQPLEEYLPGQHLPHLKMDFYICGPRAMMTSLIEGLEEAGMSGDHIHTESFNQQKGEGAITTNQHEITFTRSSKTLLWDSEFKNLLEFAESNGIAMEAGCMFGECGACSTKVSPGEVCYNYTTATTPKAGYCLPCSCHPASPMTIDA